MFRVFREIKKMLLQFVFTFFGLILVVVLMSHGQVEMSEGLIYSDLAISAFGALSFAYARYLKRTETQWLVKEENKIRAERITWMEQCLIDDKAKRANAAQRKTKKACGLSGAH